MTDQLRRLRTGLERATALTALAITHKPLPDLLVQAVHLVGNLPGTTSAGVYTCAPGGTQLTLTAAAGESLPSTRPMPAADDQPTDHVATVLRDDRADPIGLLHVGGDLDIDDAAFVQQVGEVLGVALVRGRREQELVRNEQRLIEAQRISHVGSYDFEIATNTNLWSDQLYRIYGREPQSFNATYERFLEMLLPDDREHVMSVHGRSMETLEPFEMEERIVWPDGQVRTLASWGEVVADAEGKPARMVGICWDITDRKRIEEQLIQEALHDRLTGLPNRALLVDRLAQALEVLPRRGGPLGVLFIDVDRFKVINDSLGHEAGDEVLLELARRFRTVMRPGDTVARFGGDEFVVLSEDLAHAGEALAIAERLQHETSRPIALLDGNVVVTVSTGIALSGSAFDQPSTLLRDADAAMYRAKQNGRARSVVFADEMRDEAMSRLDTEQQLRRALAEDELRLHYQPIVALPAGNVVGLEALVRWQHPTRGLVLPAEFVPIAEETGLVVPMDDWVLERACRQLAAWHDQWPDLTMSVNLSGLQFTRDDLVTRVADTLSRTGVNPERVALEMTEGVLMHDAEETMGILRGLKALGLQLHVDDFGTGFSSLTYLKRFPVDALKIDQSFVDGLATDPDDRAIVLAVVALAGSLGIATVAEGIETEEQLAVLQELGCTYAQGYLFSRPVPPDELETYLGGSTPQ